MKFARLAVGMLLLGLAASGCSRSGLGTEGEISGKVKYQGKPLPGGQITFFTSKGHTFSGPIDPDGNYKVKALVGEARIAVDNQMLEKRSGQAMGGLRPPPGVQVNVDLSKMQSSGTLKGTYVRLPEKYRSPDKSGLTYTVKSGAQTHDVELSDKP